MSEERVNGGRPKKEVTRKSHNVRAFDDEWEVIRRFTRLLKHGHREELEAVIAMLEKQYQ